MNNKFDIIVVGSGCGGMMASMLAQKYLKKRVLLIEKHFSLGGLTHSFIRRSGDKKYKWNSGVHYVGNIFNCEEDLKEAASDVPFVVNIKKLLDYITNGKIDYTKFPKEYDVFVSKSKKTYKIPEGEKAYQNMVIRHFPNEKDNFLKYFKQMKESMGDFIKNLAFHSISNSQDSLENLSSQEFFQKSTKECLDNYFNNEELKELLTYMWGNYGTKPDESPFVLHALINFHYMYGAYYPQADYIAYYFYEEFKKFGGSVLVNMGVDEIIEKDGVCCGVRLEDKTEIFSEFVISNVGTKNTYLGLLRNIDLKGHHRFENFKSARTFIDIFVGLKDNPKDIWGVEGENYWLAPTQAIKLQGIEIDNGLFVSFGSLHNYEEGFSHSCQIMGFVKNDDFLKKTNPLPYHGGEDYQAFKKQVSDFYFKTVQNQFNGFLNQVDYFEVSTQKTQQYFGNFYDGGSYDILHTKEKFEQCCVQTPIKNLYMSGSHALSLGVAGTLIGSLYAVSPILNPDNPMSGFLELINYVHEQ